MFTVATAADYAAAVLRDADTDPAVFCNVAAVSAAVETLIGSKRPERRAEGERLRDAALAYFENRART